nr:hypothetical protein [Polyangiaceae bacterium]
ARPSAPPSRKVTATLPSLDVSSLRASERPSAGAPPTSLSSTRSSLPLSALQALEGYRASGIVNLTEGLLLSSHGPATTGTLVASLLEIASGHGHFLAAIDVEDEAGEFLLFGKTSCLLVRPTRTSPVVARRPPSRAPASC